MGKFKLNDNVVIPQNFDIYEKRLCLKINSSDSGLKIKKSNHFFTNMFLLEEKKRGKQR